MLPLRLALMFFVLTIPCLREKTAEPWGLAKIESVLRERHHKPAGTFSVTIPLREEAVVVSFGTIPGGSQTAVVIDRQLDLNCLDHEHIGLGHVSMRIPCMPRAAFVRYIDLDADGIVDLVSDTLGWYEDSSDDEGTIAEIHQRDYDVLVAEILGQLTGGSQI
jgi:hypothetical protein